MHGISRTTRGTQGGTEVSCRPGRVRVSSPAVLGPSGRRWREFVERALSLSEVESVEVDRPRGFADIGYDASAVRLDDLLERMSAALASPEGGNADGSLATWQTSLAGRSRFRLVRRGTALSTWAIVHELPARLRVRDVGLPPGSLALEQLRLQLAAQPGVNKATVSSLTGSVVIVFDPAVIDCDGLLSRLDAWTRTGELVPSPVLAAPVQWLSAHATLALAVAGALVYPPLLAVSAGVLIASSLPTVHRAMLEMRQRRIGLPLLHTAIVGATLATGSFLASSLMNWLLVYWEDRRARLTARGCQLLADVRRPDGTAWVVCDGVELETVISRLEPGDVVAIRQGDVIPVDGYVLSGTAILEEAPHRFSEGLISCRSGDDVFEGSLVIEGALHVAVARTGDDTVATTIGRTMSAVAKGAVADQPPSAPKFAERAVSPALMTAGVGLVVGDATVAAAVLRPDYATGTFIGDSLTLIDQVAQCLDDGIVVRRPEVLQQMAEIDTVIFDHDRTLESRAIELDSVHVAGALSPAEILRFADCAARCFNDPRSRVIAAARESSENVGLEAPVRYRNGGVEFCDGGHSVVVEGLWATGAGPVVPIRVFADGELAGSVTFCEGRFCAASAIFELRTRCGMQVELVSSAPAEDANHLADALGADGVRFCPTDAAKAEWIGRLRAAGSRVAYVGDGRHNPLAGAAANVAVSTASDAPRADDVSGVWLMGPCFEKIARLQAFARSMRQEARWHCNLILIPNVVSVAGAFLFGFSSLVVVILSNLGTYSVYSRGRAALARTERRLTSRRNRTRPASATRPVRHIQSPITRDGT